MIPQRLDRREAALTIIELMVVIAIIGVLASLLMPSFARAIRKAKETHCLNNFKQLSHLHAFYLEDHLQKFPPGAVSEFDPVLNQWVSKPTRDTLGGKNPKPGHFARSFLQSTNRPWHDYQGNSKLFFCPEDKGHQGFPQWPICLPYHDYAKPTMFDTIGSSYQWNTSLTAPHDSSRSPPLPAVTKHPRGPSLPRMTADEIEYPDRYIMMNEPPARVVSRAIAPLVAVPFWSQWHRSRGRNDFRDPTIAPQTFWSHILFIDGHVAMHDFSKQIMTDPYYPYEDTTEWIWYQTNRATASNMP